MRPATEQPKPPAVASAGNTWPSEELWYRQNPEGDRHSFSRSAGLSVEVRFGLFDLVLVGTGLGGARLVGKTISQPRAVEW